MFQLLEDEKLILVFDEIVLKKFQLIPNPIEIYPLPKKSYSRLIELEE